MGNIVLLDDSTINKIAAGEVIERPASVVKELMENSIDAGATAIKVEIKNGGISYIRITDNGKGIAKDDMEIAFERHATSKIRKAEDLEVVTSMGFRGEALASIASISKVEMVSKTEDSDIGNRIQLEGGKVINEEETGCPKGTTITIQDLFFNTPVRYKFLKKDFTEAGYIEDAVTRIALIHPEIAISLINSGKTIIQTPGNNESKAVIYSIYGKDIAENILDVDYEYEDIKVTGVIGKPAIARSNRSNQLFFVNKRYIKDKTLTTAAEQGYKGMITIGKYGFLVLNISLNPQKVDVNVHPAKLEVRFEEENKVFKAVFHAIKDTLLKGDLVANDKLGVQNSELFEDDKLEAQSSELFANNKLGVQNSKLDLEKTMMVNSKPALDYLKKENPIAQIYANKFSTSKNSAPTNIDSTNISLENEDSINVDSKDIAPENIVPNDTNSENTISENTEDASYKLPLEGGVIKTDEQEKDEFIKEIKKEEFIKNSDEKFEKMYMNTFGGIPSEVRKREEEKKQKEEEYTVQQDEMKQVENVSIFLKEENQIPQYKFIGIAFSTYIILELNNELYILDQHAAHERILYEKVKKNYYSENEKDSQLMLLPDIINLSHKEMDIAKENMDMFRKAGFTLEEFGENTIKLSGVPNICLDLDTKELFLETLDEINTVARTAKQEKEEKFIATVACKAAVKANMALDAQEVDNLMKQLLVLPNPFTCPHGRPTAIRMTKNDIEKKFSRR